MAAAKRLLQRTMDMPKQKRRGDAPVPLPDQVALVLQGGGALGSFQAGVIESLEQLSIEIDWVAGISIGAINAAIIAGNPPELWVERLNRFWETVSGSLPALDLPEERKLRESIHLGAAAMVAMWGVPGFFHPNLVPSWLAPAGSLQALAYYDTSPLRQTLDALVDWERVNHGPMRFSVGAVDVENGNFVYFDNRHPEWRGRIDARHVMASGALPPGFPPVEIDGRYYWDGGLVSNTPLSHVLDHQDGDLLVFQVDLFPAEGPLPQGITGTYSRQKDIQYSSRTRQVTDEYMRRQRAQETAQALIDSLPPEHAASPEAQKLIGLFRNGAVNVVHLIYRTRPWESGARDFEFSRTTMLDHWAQGRAAVAAVIAKGNELLASNINEGRSATFDLSLGGQIKEKQV